MKLPHSIRVVEKLVARFDSDPRGLTSEERSAVLVVMRFAKRVMAAKESLRALSRAVAGEDDLNQEELVLDPDKP